MAIVRALVMLVFVSLVLGCASLTDRPTSTPVSSMLKQERKVLTIESEIPAKNYWRAWWSMPISAMSATLQLQV